MVVRETAGTTTKFRDALYRAYPQFDTMTDENQLDAIGQVNAANTFEVTDFGQMSLDLIVRFLRLRCGY
jgi:hypothetical protein